MELSSWTPFEIPTSVLTNFNADKIAGIPAAIFFGFLREIPVC